MTASTLRASGLALLIIAALTMTGCGGGGGGTFCTPPTVNVTGNWTGTWQSENGVDHGTLALSGLIQQGATVNGQANFTGSPCLSGTTLAGLICGQNFSGQLTADGIQVSFSATVIATQMTGTYDTMSAGTCTGDSGTFSLQR
jgi:hypothetical protein